MLRITIHNKKDNTIDSYCLCKMLYSVVVFAKIGDILNLRTHKYIPVPHGEPSSHGSTVKYRPPIICSVNSVEAVLFGTCWNISLQRPLKVDVLFTSHSIWSETSFYSSVKFNALSIFSGRVQKFSYSFGIAYIFKIHPTHTTLCYQYRSSNSI